MHIPDNHTLHDHLNKQRPVPLSAVVTGCCWVEIVAAQREAEAGYTWLGFYDDCTFFSRSLSLMHTIMTS